MRACTICATSTSKSRGIPWSSSRASPAPASRPSPSTRSSPRASAATSSRSRAYARQFLGQVDRPDVDFIEGLSPAVSIDQKSTNRNPRSTVGTITEIYDYMRLLWARIGVPHCPECGEAIQRQTVQQIADQLMELEPGTRYQIVAPVVSQKKGEFVDLFKELARKGYSRAIVDGEPIQLDEPPDAEEAATSTTSPSSSTASSPRPTSSAGSPTRSRPRCGLTDGLVQVNFVDEEGDAAWQHFSEKLACPNGHPLQLTEIEPRTFSFNAPFGACPECSGLGTRMSVDVDLLLGDPELSIAEGVLIPLDHAGQGALPATTSGCSRASPPTSTSRSTPRGATCRPTCRRPCCAARTSRSRSSGRTATAARCSYSSGFEGVVPYIERQYLQAETRLASAAVLEYLREIAVPGLRRQAAEARGARRHHPRPQHRGCLRLSLTDAHEFIDRAQLTDREAKIAAQVLREIRVRLDFLIQVGLNYLDLARAAGTLSGGEAQRIRLATQIGSGLTGVLYVLDEPSIGLHQRDNRRLIETLVKLRDLGNTLIVVEHDEDTIRTADWIVDIGPGAGVNGGKVVHSGPYEALLANSRCRSPATTSPAGGRSRRRPSAARSTRTGMITVEGARANNLEDVTVDFPLGTFIAVTGVSGSGKSSLVNDILYQVLANRLNGARQIPGKHTRVTGLDNLDKVVHVDQAPIGRTPRSNPATYTGRLRPHPHPVHRDASRRRPAATCPAASASTSRAAAARPARATARSRSR